MYGRLPGYRLSDKGQQMVRLSAEEFAARAERGARFVHLVCSPLQRTRESAAPVEELLGLTAQPDERVIEADNYFEGLHVNAQELLRNPRHWMKLYNPARPSWGCLLYTSGAEIVRTQLVQGVDIGRVGGDHVRQHAGPLLHLSLIHIFFGCK